MLVFWYTGNQRFLCPWYPIPLLHFYQHRSLQSISRPLLVVVSSITRFDVLRTDVLPLSLPSYQLRSLTRMNVLKTYAFVYGVPDPICDSIVCPKFPISCPFSSSMADVESVHFKAERRSEHNTEEDIVPSEKEAKYPVRLAGIRHHGIFRDPGCLVCDRKGWGDLLVERSTGGRLPLTSLARSKNPYTGFYRSYIPFWVMKQRAQLCKGRYCEVAVLENGVCDSEAHDLVSALIRSRVARICLRYDCISASFKLFL